MPPPMSPQTQLLHSHRYCRLLHESQLIYPVEKSMTNAEHHKVASPHAMLTSQLRLAKKHGILHVVWSGSQSMLSG